jgi:hypothetical protein
LALAAADLKSIEVVPERAQSADQARRDRYECHNWAVGETGTAPLQVDATEEAAHDRADRAARIIGGAATGAAIGGVVQSVNHNDVAEGVFAGAVIGAVVGTLTGRKRNANEPDSEFDAYFRALSACLEARGYHVTAVSGEAQSERE